MNDIERAVERQKQMHEAKGIVESEVYQRGVIVGAVLTFLATVLWEVLRR
jgi:hypothetical protein